MRRSYWTWLWLAGGVLLAVVAVADPTVFLTVLRQPFDLLWSSQEKLGATLIDLSDDHGAIEAAGRRLLKPFTRVRLIRRIPVPNPGDHH